MNLPTTPPARYSLVPSPSSRDCKYQSAKLNEKDKKAWQFKNLSYSCPLVLFVVRIPPVLEGHKSKYEYQDSTFQGNPVDRILPLIFIFFLRRPIKLTSVESLGRTRAIGFPFFVMRIPWGSMWSKTEIQFS